MKNTFFNSKIKGDMREEKNELIKKFKNIKNTDRMVDVLGLHFYIKIFYKKNEDIHISSDYGPELFIYENNNG